jgi:beta-glucosidase
MGLETLRTWCCAAAFAGLSLSVALAQSSDGTAESTASATPASAYEPLVDRLTLEESMDMLGGVGFGTHSVPRLGIPSFQMSDGPSGVRSPGPSTAYAAGIGLAATWDPDVAHAVGRQLGRDARARGSRYLLGPGVNIYRAPTNGRNFEYFGEDPWLGSRIAVEYIRGVQEQGVSATVKHFVGNNSEFARHTSDSRIDERALREIYLPIFEAAVKEARVGAVMSSYNLTNGEHMSANVHLLRDVLKGDWGFDGVLMSDWGGTYDGVAAALAGQDLEMPTGRHMNRDTLLPAIRSGKLSEEDVKDKVRRQLRLADRFRWGAGPPADLSIPRLNPEGRSVAYRGALEGAVLLKNQGDVLPIDPKRVKTIAVIGPTAYPSPSTGGGSGHVTPYDSVSILEGLSRKLSPDVTVTHARGIVPPAIINLLTRFTTDAAGSEPGVAVEVFADESLSGAPQAHRVEAQFSRQANGSRASRALFDWLPADEAAAAVDGLINAPAQRTYERWTGWFTPSRAGMHTLSVAARARYRLFVDDELVIDSTRIPKAALAQLKYDFSAAPHKIVLEQAASHDFGDPTWQVNIVRDGSFVQARAKELAARADVAIVAVGYDQDSEGERDDREFALPPGQDELIREIAAVNPNTIVVVTAGGAVDVRAWLDQVRGLLTVWYPGQEGGAALADLLVGEASPSGRLPISWERAPQDDPSHDSYYYNDATNPDAIVYRDGIFVGYRGYQRSGRKPQFPFGFGLTYTTFSYTNLSVQRASARAREDAAPLYVVSFDVTNTGSHTAADVAQVYVGESNSRVERPARELKGFARTELKPGQTRTVSIPLNGRSFAYYDTGARAWRADAGEYRVEVGQSSENILGSTTVRLPRRIMLRP